MNTTSMEDTNIGNTGRKVDRTPLRDMFLLGFTTTNIMAAFGMTRRAVCCALIRMELIPGRQKHKREVLSNGKVRCSICHESKKASKFNDTASYCTSCGYDRMAQQSNRDMDLAIHIREVWTRNRAKRLHIPYELTEEQLTELYVTQRGRCAYCDEPMVMELGDGRKGYSASIERIIPQTRGGTYTLANVVWVHFVCNARRQALTGERLKVSFPEASKAIEQVAQARQLELPFPTDSEINVTNDPEPQPAAA
jgi:hypothetical protein